MISVGCGARSTRIGVPGETWKLAMRTATFVVGTEINAVPYILSISGNTHGCRSFDKSTTLPHFIRFLCFISSLCFYMFLWHGKSHGLLHVNWRLIGVQTMVFKKTVLLNAQVWHFLIPNKPLCLAYNWPCLQNVGTEIDSIGRACTSQILGNLAVAIVRFVRNPCQNDLRVSTSNIRHITLGFWKVAQAKSIKHHWVSNGSRKEDSAPGKKLKQQVHFCATISQSIGSVKLFGSWKDKTLKQIHDRSRTISLLKNKNTCFAVFCNVFP